MSKKSIDMGRNLVLLPRLVSELDFSEAAIVLEALHPLMLRAREAGEVLLGCGKVCGRRGPVSLKLPRGIAWEVSDKGKLQSARRRLNQV
jgi:hypothetical protein